MGKRQDQGGWPPSGFGIKLREVRESKGLTQSQLADAAGCNPITVSKLERGIQEPAWPLVLALASAMGVDCKAFAEVAVEKPSVDGPAEPPAAEPEPAPKEKAKKKGGAK